MAQAERGGSEGEGQRFDDRGTEEGSGSGGPVSRYYTGPPSKYSFFGKKQVGVIGEHLPMEIIRIERDYSLAPSHIPQFHPTFPLELEGRITPTHFSELINDINELLIQANDPGWAALDNMLAVVTLWISPWVLGSRYQRKSRELVRLLADRNRTLLNPSGLNLLHPSSKAWLYLELEYY
ncbi:hypothetical protein BCV69DRAFT_279447 [Microstroma glucosiphilum]|uniref:Ras modification protein ERF4 n=1 Tax=Pseudomicrostroma glucosiphilum TaxID=1684307 RepID=A0A316UE70_9BASI|nr:hypothetical protein BCV69DRAFT_279447 [Pseudomicrostroma glucosiphilum]PWN23519.1 hypothetical protein BCV69DRAFT_279447 [Pseudomicrostroma glucosiphilum]